jgi:hypothetical protein
LSGPSRSSSHVFGVGDHGQIDVGGPLLHLRPCDLICDRLPARDQLIEHWVLLQSFQRSVPVKLRDTMRATVIDVTVGLAVLAAAVGLGLALGSMLHCNSL